MFNGVTINQILQFGLKNSSWRSIGCDVFRGQQGWFLPRKGFLRTSTKYVLSPDGTKLNYTLVEKAEEKWTKIKEEKENMILAVGGNCKSECALFLNDLQPLDNENSDEVKALVDQICTLYIKRVTDSIVSDDIDSGNVQEVNEMITELNNASDNNAAGEMEVQPVSGDVEGQ